MTTNYIGFAAERRRQNSHPLPRGTYYHPRYALAPFTAPSIFHWDDIAGQDDIPRALPRLEVRSTENRGLGLFARDRIPAFSCILEDHAMLSLANGEDLPHLWPKYLALPPEDAETFDALGTPEQQVQKENALISKLVQRGYPKERAIEMSKVSSRFLGNSFKTYERQSPWQYALFATVARVNHSCTPNAHAHYRRTTGAQYLTALRDVEPGQEIEIAYFDITAPLAKRQTRMHYWSFQCSCPACSGAMDSGYHRDLAVVHEWNHVDKVLQLRKPTHSPGLPNRIERAISIAKSDDYPWLRTNLPNLYQNLANALMSEQAPKNEVIKALEESSFWNERILGPGYPGITKAQFIKRNKLKQGRYGQADLTLEERMNAVGDYMSE